MLVGHIKTRITDCSQRQNRLALREMKLFLPSCNFCQLNLPIEFLVQVVGSRSNHPSCYHQRLNLLPSISVQHGGIAVRIQQFLTAAPSFSLFFLHTSMGSSMGCSLLGGMLAPLWSTSSFSTLGVSSAFSSSSLLPMFLPFLYIFFHSCIARLADGLGYSLWWVHCQVVQNQLCLLQGRPCLPPQKATLTVP